MIELPNSGFELPAAEEARLPEERMEIPGMTAHDAAGESEKKA